MIFGDMTLCRNQAMLCSLVIYLRSKGSESLYIGSHGCIDRPPTERRASLGHPAPVLRIFSEIGKRGKRPGCRPRLCENPTRMCRHSHYPLSRPSEIRFGGNLPQGRSASRAFLAAALDANRRAAPTPDARAGALLILAKDPPNDSSRSASQRARYSSDSARRFEHLRQPRKSHELLPHSPRA
jgi:hypothetical protein